MCALEEEVQEVLALRASKGVATDESALRIYLSMEGANSHNVCGSYFLPLDMGPKMVRHGWSAWVAPSGRVWSLPYGGHHDFASLFGQSCSIMERAGFIHMSGGRFDVFYELTNAQERVFYFLKAKWEEYFQNRSSSFEGHPYFEDRKGQHANRVAQDQWGYRLRLLNSRPSPENLAPIVRRTHIPALAEEYAQ